MREQLLTKWSALKTKLVSQRTKITSLTSELEKERGWWDKWMNDKYDWFYKDANGNLIMNFHDGIGSVLFFLETQKINTNLDKKLFWEKVYSYYKNQ